ncbi:hypothetical protein Hanom_Chr08g00735271 [Helianthus anomalus]
MTNCFMPVFFSHIFGDFVPCSLYVGTPSTIQKFNFSIVLTVAEPLLDYLLYATLNLRGVDILFNLSKIEFCLRFK